MVNKRVWNAVLGYNLKNDRMISVRFQGKPFNITVTQVYAPTSNAEEAEVERFYENLQDLLELKPKKDVLFIIRNWNAKVGSQETPGVTGKFGLRIRNEAGQRLIEFCQENTLVITNTLFQQHERTLYTWTSPDTQHQNQIDYILCCQRWRSSTRSDHSLSRVRLFATPWIAAHQASLSITNSRSSLRPTSIESVMLSSHLILCRPLLLLPPTPPNITVFSNESTLHLRWPKYWSFSFSIIPSKETPGLISFRMDWLDLLAVQGTLKSLFQHHSSKASILGHSAFLTVQLSHPYMTTGKNHSLD